MPIGGTVRLHMLAIQTPAGQFADLSPIEAKILAADLVTNALKIEAAQLKQGGDHADIQF
jgi:predicted outer membrane protein